MSDGSSAVSYYNPEAPVSVLLRERWNSDEFDAMVYGSALDPNQPFFPQWQRLSQLVPRPHNVQFGRMENSEWVTFGIDYKNSYGCYSGIANEDAIYSDSSGYCKQILELSLCAACEFSYDCVGCRRSSRLRFCERCDECLDLTFSLGCENCADCFGCTNLRHKKFCFLNEQLSEDEYRQRVAAIDLTDSLVVEEWRVRISDFWEKSFRRASLVMHSEDAVGDDIESSRSVYGISIRRSERVYGVRGCISFRDSIRCSSGVESERCVGSYRPFHSSEIKFSFVVEQSLDVEYSDSLAHCEHCFGCVGLKNKKFCIFNKQYSEEEYWPLVDAIKTAMLKRGEYGEFFPLSASPIANNLSQSGMMFPRPEAEIARLGGRWYRFPNAEQTGEAVSAIPTRLADVPDSIVSRRFLCPVTGRSFFFIPAELAMHREMGVALPRVHSIVNRERRTVQALPPRLYQRVCDSCGTALETGFPSDYSSPILCSACYEAVVIGEKVAPVAAASK